MAKKDIKYGSVTLDADELNMKNAKVRLNMWIDGDVVEKIRTLADEEGLKYQTYINKLLRDSVFGNTIEKRLKAIEKILIVNKKTA